MRLWLWWKHQFAAEYDKILIPVTCPSKQYVVHVICITRPIFVYSKQFCSCQNLTNLEMSFKSSVEKVKTIICVLTFPPCLDKIYYSKKTVFWQSAFVIFRKARRWTQLVLWEQGIRTFLDPRCTLQFWYPQFWTNLNKQENHTSNNMIEGNVN